MNKTNFHTHNYRCEHAVGNVEDYVKVAIREGYAELGISDHAPMPEYYKNNRMKEEDFNGYLKEIKEAQEKYGNKIKIYKSLEIEYFPEFLEKYDRYREKLDYLVLGLHAFRKDGDDTNYNAWKIETGEDVLAYAQFMVEAIESGKFDYIAHPDLYVINYRTWDESCEKAAHMIAKAAEKMDVPLEVNANGIRKTFERHPDWDRYMYPYKEFWEIVKQYNVRAIIGSDAHDFNRMEDREMEIAREFAKEIGLTVIESIF